MNESQKNKLFKILNKFKNRKVLLIAIILVIVIVISDKQFFKHAQTLSSTGQALTSSTEAENGSLISPATVQTDSTASGGKKVSFNTPKSKPVFIIYYLWWDNSHWTSHLGTSYPYTTTPNPLPSTYTEDTTTNKCSSTTNYTGNVLNDISQNLAYDQTNYQTVLNDVTLAAKTGATGFSVNWIGTGLSTQTNTSSNYNKRLAFVFQAVHAINAQGIPFKIMLNYQSSASFNTTTQTGIPLAQFTNDFNYLLTNYGSDPALDHTYSPKLENYLAGTWKYQDADLKAVSDLFRPTMYLIGDEKGGNTGNASWNSTLNNKYHYKFFDAASYYWSSQDPYLNAASFTQLKSFQAEVKSTKNPDGSDKMWLAPFSPGYNGLLYYTASTTCIPRYAGATMKALYDGNLASTPDGWTFISWNEITEGTYIVPLTRYNTDYTNYITNIINNGQ